MDLTSFQQMDSLLLLSIINTKLRDFHSDLDDLASEYDIDKQKLCEKLAKAGYIYQSALNQFKPNQTT